MTRRAQVRRVVIFAFPLKVADLRTARILCGLVVGMHRWARSQRTCRAALAPLELHLCAAQNGLRVLHKSEHYAAMRGCAGAAFKM